MFYDWLTIFQDHDERLPFLGAIRELVIDVETGDTIGERQPAYQHKGSFSTSISIRIAGGRITVKGNPSRINRIDNLFGFKDIDSCIRVYNQILLGLNLPPFTRCTKIINHFNEQSKKYTHTSNGATIQELHITTNKTVGKGNVSDFIRGLSTQRYRNSIPRLHSNGCTLDWLSKKGNASLIYPSVYDKANEIQLHQLDKIKRLHGEYSPEYAYLQRVNSYCIEHGVVRFEQKLKSRFLIREDLRFWGLHNFTKLNKLQDEFITLDKNLGVNAMTYQSIAELLKEEEICKSTASANATANYYFMWLHGQHFDLEKRQVQTHRARLRQINIDIAEKCDTTKHTALRIKEVREIEVKELTIPDWYQQPSLNHLRLVA
jgi:II/X family phage/plasmid replication protein